jgi:flagellar biosynthesis/type III secretory pathway protein FliH
MSNGIYLTLEQYKDKDLPITITINGHTYHSQYALATAQTTWFEMGKQHGMELAADNTYSDKEMARMHNAWYDEGYEAGKAEATSDIEMQWMHDQWYNEGYEAGIDHGIEQTLQDDRVKEEIERTREQAYKEGYEAGKKANGYSSDDIKQLHTDNEFTRKVWYDKGKAEGYGEGYNDGYEQCKHDNQIEHDPCKDCKEEPGKDEQNAKEIPGEYLSHIEEARLEGYADGFNDGKEQGFEEGFMNLKLILKK